MPLAKAMMEAAGNSTQSVYIEDVFSTYLYNGNGSTQTITNGIDLSTKGGLVWIKNRISAFGNHLLSDSARGLGTTVYKTLSSNLTDAQNTTTNDGVSAFNANGFSVTGSSAAANDGGSTYTSWTFRKQPKFFDVVTYTGSGASGKVVNHSLGSVPGCIIIKRTDAAGDAWCVWHRGIHSATNETSRLLLNTTATNTSFGGTWLTSVTSTAITFAAGFSNFNASGATYVAYLFAHNAGGFGLTGTDNVISCGSYTGNGSATGPVVTLGYEPQWVLVKSASGTTANWFLCDTMRGFPTATGSETRYPLIPNSTDAEATYASSAGLYPTSTGFSINTSAANFNQSGASYIYIAIRRGPMKTPTSGTSVFDVETFTGGASTKTLTSGFPPDMTMLEYRSSWNYPIVASRLTGKGKLIANQTDAENTTNTSWIVTDFDSDTGTTKYNDYGGGNLSSRSVSNGFVSWMFRRAPGFFDEVCFYSPGSNAVNPQRHNLGVAPELIILKNRNDTYQWFVGANFTSSAHAFGYLNLTNSMPSGAYSTGGVFSAQPDATNFYYGNLGGFNYVAYLFASCPGVSKVGSYTGTGTTQQINCGFTGGARFVLIKRTDSTGDWYVWDTARGIVAGNDPYLLLNSTAAEVTSTDYIDTYSAGFEISSTAPAAINASGGTFIYLAIA